MKIQEEIKIVIFIIMMDLKMKNKYNKPDEIVVNCHIFFKRKDNNNK